MRSIPLLLAVILALLLAPGALGAELGDFDGDGDVDARDVAAFARAWREFHRPGGTADPLYDLAGEGHPGPRASEILGELYLAGLSPSPHDLFASALRYAGSPPTPTPISYETQDGPVTARARPAQVQVVLENPADGPRAVPFFSSQGGSVIARIPSTGYYLIQTGAAAEAAFIRAMRQSSMVYLACPHLATRYGAVATTVVDHCGGTHGDAVEKVLTDRGVPVSECRSDADGAGRPVSTWTLYETEREIAQSKTTPALINISSYYGLADGGDWATENDASKKSALRAYTDDKKALLKTISEMPLMYRVNLVITLCAGNDNMPLDSVLAELSADPRLLDVLRRNVLIVGSKGQSFSNHASPLAQDFAWVDNPEAAQGTSYAAPFALSIISRIMTQRGVSATEALRIAKEAVAANPGRELVEAEVLGPVGGDYEGPFAGSTTDTADGSVWKADLSVDLSVTVTGQGILGDPYDVSVTFEGNLIQTLIQCADPGGCDPGGTYPVAGSGHTSSLGKILFSATEDRGGDLLTLTLTEGAFSPDGLSLKGTLTASSDTFDAPIVKEIALSKKP